MTVSREVRIEARVHDDRDQAERLVLVEGRAHGTDGRQWREVLLRGPAKTVVSGGSERDPDTMFE